MKSINSQEFERSQEDLDAALELDPRNVLVQESLRELQRRRSALDKKYANAMKKMFG